MVKAKVESERLSGRIEYKIIFELEDGNTRQTYIQNFLNRPGTFIYAHPGSCFCDLCKAAAKCGFVPVTGDKVQAVPNAENRAYLPKYLEDELIALMVADALTGT